MSTGAMNSLMKFNECGKNTIMFFAVVVAKINKVKI